MVTKYSQSIVEHSNSLSLKDIWEAPIFKNLRSSAQRFLQTYFYQILFFVVIISCWKILPTDGSYLRVYSSISLIGWYKETNPYLTSSELHINLDGVPGIEFINNHTDGNFVLGDLSKFSISNIPNHDEFFKNFLGHTGITNLDSFVFNYAHHEGDKGRINIAYYMKELKEILQNVQKEVFIGSSTISDSDLNQIVTSSSNSERLILSNSKIITSDNLDFSIPGAYKTKYLSFLKPWNDEWSNMEWDVYPERFEKIIKAIANSGLRHSLEKINIRGYKISIHEVEIMLAKHGLSHIKIIQEWNDPI